MDVSQYRVDAMALHFFFHYCPFAIVIQRSLMDSPHFVPVMRIFDASLLLASVCWDNTIWDGMMLMWHHCNCHCGDWKMKWIKGIYMETKSELILMYI